jgi:DNA repair protein RecO (recombination protein O)
MKSLIAKPASDTNISPGLVLDTRVSAEADLQLVIFTREFGKLRLYAKSALKSRKRFAGQLLLFNHLEVSIASSRRSGMLRLDQSRLLESFPAVRTDIRRVGSASCLCEMVDLASPEFEPVPGIYELLLSAFRELDQGKDPDRVRLIFQLKIISLLGFRPSLENCANCGKKLGERGLKFSSKAGGIVCRECAGALKDSEKISPGAVKSLRMALIMPGDKTGRLGFTKKTLQESEHFVTSFVRFHLHRPLRSEAFLQKLESG